MENNNIGVMLKMEWLVDENSIIPEGKTEVRCSSCGMRFAVPNDEYKQLVGILDGTNINFICEDCVLQNEDDEFVDDEPFNDELSSEDPGDVINEALGN